MKTFFFDAANNHHSAEWKAEAKSQEECDTGDRRLLHDATRLDAPCSSEQESPLLPRRFACPQLHCEKTFASKYKLCRHMVTHSLQKSHQCSHCGKMFHRKDHLKNHLQTHNPNRVALQCPECSKNYSTKYGHRRHLALHAIARGDLSCAICLQVFQDRQAVLEHLKSHNHRPTMGSREKKYPCEHCDRCFYTRKDVRRHLVVHTGRKDFQCHCCAQMFGRKDHLTRHMKKSHCEEAPRIKMEPQDDLSHMSCQSTVVKEEWGAIKCMPSRDMIPPGMYPTSFQPISNNGIPQSLVPTSLSLGLSYPTESVPTFSTDPSNRFQFTSTLYLPKSEMDPFMSDGSGGLCLTSPELAPCTPQDESYLSALCDPLSSAVDFNHFLSFLPINFPPLPNPEIPMGESQQFLAYSNGSGSDLPHYTSDINPTALPQFHQAFK